jgi:hypothetical protein
MDKICPRDPHRFNYVHWIKDDIYVHGSVEYMGVFDGVEQHCFRNNTVFETAVNIKLKSKIATEQC